MRGTRDFNGDLAMELWGRRAIHFAQILLNRSRSPTGFRF
jgi:hypothetical protein